MEFDHVGVVGGGTAGRGIAIALASIGVEVILCERSHRLLENSLDAIRDALDREIARWAITESERDAVLARIQGTTDLDDLGSVPLVIEAITETFKAKSRLLENLDRVCAQDAFFFTNTSTLGISDLAESLSRVRRGRLVGVHFLHPVSRVHVVELIRGRETSEDALEVARQVAEALGKSVVEVEEYPGYVTSRLTLTLINEAIYILMEGVATRDSIDRAMKLRFGWSHGPLALADEMGLDSCLRALDSMVHELGSPQYRACPLLRRMVTRGLLGEKTGRGFYRYDDQGRRIESEAEDLTLPKLDSLLGGAP